jgi:phosphoenolpyruvate phosphomutase
MTDKKEKTVYVGITGDMIHPGIINIIQQGAKYGRLIVGLLSNTAIATHKRIPYLTYEQRKAVIENIKGVSEVVPQEEWSYVPNLEKLKPDYIIHGDDWKTNYLKGIREEVFEVMKKIGGEVIEIPYTKGINSSQLFENTTNNGITAVQRLKSLRQLMNYKPIIRIMEANSGLSGLIIENLKIEKEDGINRFDGIFINPFDSNPSGISSEHDSTDFTSKINTVTDILECTTKPIIYGGYTSDNYENITFTVEKLELMGISAMIIEDRYKNKNELCNEEEFCLKIKEGKKSQTNPDFMIIARIEELNLGKNIDDALKKSFASINAGADAILISSNQKTGDDIKEFCLKFRKENKNIPIVLIPTTYNQCTEKEFSEWGANIIIYSDYLKRVTYPAMKKCAETILKSERSLEVNEMCMPIKEILNLIPGTN